jgi:DNA repair protein SbcD/Mre11
MKILHTSDWHLGRNLYGRKRYEEFSAFLDWMIITLEQHHIDILLIAGDIFDTHTPSNRAQKLYFNFLAKISSTSCCRHIVVIAGNHDSPSFLEAPKDLLNTLNIHIVGVMGDTLDKEVVTLNNEQGTPEAIICAVPYLRDKDIRIFEPGDNIDKKNTKLAQGLTQHYAQVCMLAQTQREEWINAGYKAVPIIAMGHLFTSGGKTMDGDGVRELYVGSLAHVGHEIFPDFLDYVALGHLHVPQTVGQNEHIRYSGSPIPMGFGEALQKKHVITVDFDSAPPYIEEISVPLFQRLVRIKGSHQQIIEELKRLTEQNTDAWLEIDYTGTTHITNLREQINAAVMGTELEVLRVKQQRVINKTMSSQTKYENLDELDTLDVFKRCLYSNEIQEQDQRPLTEAYNEIIQLINEDDAREE